MIVKKILLIFLFFLYIAIALFFISQNKKKAPIKTPSEKLNIYSIIEKELLSTVHQKDPSVSLIKLRTYMKQYKEVRDECHTLAHKIGRTSYEKYQDFSKAVTYDITVCNSGYFHGVIEAYFLNEQDLYASLYTLCEGYNDRRCYHGIGHALMLFTDNNLTKSLSDCDTLQEKYKKYCYEGVFMENFTSNQNLHPSKFLKEKDPSFPCVQQHSRYKNICYYYTTYYFLSLYPEQYKQGLTWCKTLESSYISQCLRGMGAQIMLATLPDVKKSETMCMHIPKDQRSWCIDGMIGLYLDSNPNKEALDNLCSVMRKENYTFCINAIKKRNNWIPQNIL